jgi:hypothetical protein
VSGNRLHCYFPSRHLQSIRSAIPLPPDAQGVNDYGYDFGETEAPARPYEGMRMKSGISPGEIWRGWQSLQEDMAYDRMVESTPEGQRSRKLRDHAQGLLASGEYEAAHRYFEEACRLFAEHDQGAAAAAARHDLGDSYLHRRHGSRMGNLLAAEHRVKRHYF